MVDLPTPQRRLTTTEAPRDGVSARERAAAGAVLGRGLSNFGKGLEDVAVELAKNEATENVNKAVSFDANGKVQVDTPQTSFLLNARAADAYEKTVNDRVAPHVRTQVDQDLLDIRQKHQGNPDAYRKEASAYLEKWKNQDDAVGRIAFPYAERVASGHYSNEVTAKSARDLDVAKREMTGRLSLIEDRIDGLSGQGAVNTPEYKQLMEERKQILDRMQSNPLLKVSPELRAQYEESFATKQLESGLIGRYRRSFEATGDRATTLKQAEAEIDKLPISQNRKLQLLGKVTSHISGNAAVRIEQKIALREEMKGVVAQMNKDGWIDEKKYQEFAGKLRGFRMYRELADLETRKAMAPAIYTIRFGEPAATAAAMEYLKVLKADAANDVATPSTGITARSGVNTSAIQADVQKRVASLQEVAKAAGVPFVVTSGYRDPDHNARVGGARHSQHTHGNAVDIKLPPDPEKARKLVKLIADSGVPGMGYYPNSNSIHIDYRATTATWGTNYRSSSVGVGGDAEIWKIITSRNVTPGPAGSLPGVTPGIVAGPINQAMKAYNDGVKGLFADVKKAYEAGVAPPQDVFANFSAMAGSVSDPKLYKEMQEFFQKQDLEKRFEGLPVAQARAGIQRLRLLGEKGMLRQGQIAALGNLEKEADQKAKDLSANPLSLAKSDPTLPAEARNLAPLDFSTPGALAVAMKQRATLLNTYRNKEPLAGHKALEPEEVHAIKNAWSSADAKERIRIVTEMASALDANSLRDTMQQIAGSESEIFAATGMIAKQNPQLAGSIIRGQSYMDAGAVKIKDDEASRRELQKNMPPNMMGAKQWEAYKDLVHARYADLVQARGDTSAVLNPSLLKQAVTDVTGGVIDYGKFKVIAPWPGATYRDLTGALKAVPDYEIKGAKHADGRAVTLEEIRSRANLVSVGDGLYRPFFGSDPNSGWVFREDGKPLTINLGNKKGLPPYVPGADIPVMGLF